MQLIFPEQIVPFQTESGGAFQISTPHTGTGYLTRLVPFGDHARPEMYRRMALESGPKSIVYGASETASVQGRLALPFKSVDWKRSQVQLRRVLPADFSMKYDRDPMLHTLQPSMDRKGQFQFKNIVSPGRYEFEAVVYDENGASASATQTLQIRLREHLDLGMIQLVP